jgi:hypothetical protein
MESNLVRANRADIGNKKAADEKNYRSGLTHHMLALLEEADGKNIEIGTVISTLSGGNHAVLIVFLSFPLCLPVSIPVISTTLGLALALVGLLLAIGREVWIPKFAAAKILPYDRLRHLIERLLRVSSRIDAWFHPRMSFFVSNKAIIRVHGSFVMLLGLVGAIPLPLPFNNFVAAFPVLLLGFSLLEEDGLLAILSYFTAIPFLIYYGALAYFGRAGFERLMSF